MPAAAPVVASAALSAGVSYATGATLFGLTVAQSASAVFAANIALGLVSSSLQKKPKAATASFTATTRDRTQTLRQPISYRRLAYGTIKVGGSLTFYEATSSNRYHHMVITLCDGPIDEIGTVYINDTPIYTSMLDGSGNVTSGDYANKVRIKKHLGTTAQTADSDLIAEVTSLDSNFRGRGVAYLYVRIDWDQATFPNGLPNVSAIVRGKTVYDTRDAVTRYNDNPILCIRDYLTNTTVGLGIPSAEINETVANSNANICDEFVTALSESHAVTTVTTGTPGTLTVDGDALKFHTGDRAQVTSTGSIPSGISALTNYYIIVTQERGTNKIQLATTYANALSKTAIAITDSGSGTITVTRNGVPRYTLAGVVSADQDPFNVITEMLTSCAGDTVWSQGTWYSEAGAYTTPTVTITQDDIISIQRIQTKLSRRDRFNTVQGTYVSIPNDGQPTDYPAITNVTYVTQDGGAQRYAFDLPFTYRVTTAQRLAKIELERVRQDIGAEIVVNLKGMQLRAGDTVYLTDSGLGWSEKPFIITDWAPNSISAQNGVSAFSVRLSIRETASTIYNFTSATDETLVDPAPNTTLPSPFNIQPPTGLTVTSGTDVLYLKDDGTVVSRIKATWTASTDGLTTGYEIQYKKSSASDWEPAVTSNDTTRYIWDVEDGISYDVRVRAIVSPLGIASSYATVTGHTVVGKTAAPSDVASFAASQNGNVVTFIWSQVSDLDLSGYEIRYSAQGQFSWQSSNVISSITKGTLVSNTALPPGSWTVGIKAVDTSKNYSTNATTADIDVSAINTVIDTFTETTPFANTTLDGCIVHEVSGTIRPKSNTLAINSPSTFSKFVYDPVISSYATGPELDAGFNSSDLRLWGSVVAAAGVGETGLPDVQLQIRHRTEAGTYDAWEDWTVGTPPNSRYAQVRYKMDSTTTVPYISQYSGTLDEEIDTKTGASVVIAASGTTVTFDRRFHTTPVVTVTVISSSALYAVISNTTATGFTCNVFNSAGTDVGGTINWSATGV